MADAVITITVPEAYKQRVIDSCTNVDGKMLEVAIFPPNYGGGKGISRLQDLTGLTNIEKAKKILREMLICFVKLNELTMDETRYKGDVEAVDPPAETVPEDLTY